MGELWCVPWTAESASGGGEASITATAFATVAPARFERRLSIRADEPVLHAHYRIDNLDVRPLPFTWGIHPALAVSPAHRIDHPGKTMLVGVSSHPSMGVAGSRYSWPGLPDVAAPGGIRDMSRVRPRSDAVFGGHWATDLPEGWLALTDSSTGRGVGIVFDPSLFRHAWLWQVYGGWRGHHHVALEPWTSSPMQLDEAVPAGQALVLEADGSIEADVEIVVFGEDRGPGGHGGALERLRRRAEAIAAR
jgi:galactose mutarotase-like enzyme